MIFDSVRLALKDLFRPEFRKAFIKTLLLTLLALVVIWFGLKWLFDFLALPFLTEMMRPSGEWASWLGTLSSILFAILSAFGLAFMVAPASALVAGLFQDDVAERVEETSYPEQPVGQSLPLGESAVASLKFLAIVIIGNIFALLMLLIPGVNLIAFFVVNGYLLGREFFEFAAMRYRTPSEARAFRAEHRVTIFLAGLAVALFLAIPFLNLLTPLFATSMMVHLHKRLSVRS
ncbi:sulfate transporter family protein [Limoniibacter endophyticus]|uniref:Cysteine biosynthesis protein n=1 Tax=Limoniibacter endophyticus TaxID=1565040 RepID=A0A8J3DV79_9HYPH|nr:sulfate transporter family protein [Limoniibacter endophyticus]GHC80639.1 cysteine biosynthesis protein [Limoniibacter endophyticus]